MPKEQFTRIFGHEHREIRDALLDLVEAFRAKNPPQIRQWMERVSKLIAPHLRYKEESLYRSLVDLFGHDYLQRRLEEHDRAIGNVQRLEQISRGESFSDEEVLYAVQLIREILPHVADSAGLSLMVERLPEQRVRSLLAAHDQCRASKVNLEDWTIHIRNRPAVPPATSHIAFGLLEVHGTD
jgi:hypothetical protein